MSTPTPKIAPTPEQNLFDAAKAVVERMLALETDADLVSVMSIARAHGYKPTTRFWHEETAALAKALNAYHESKKPVDNVVQLDDKPTEVSDCPKKKK
jgi:hypothetical protein